MQLILWQLEGRLLVRAQDIAISLLMVIEGHYLFAREDFLGSPSRDISAIWGQLGRFEATLGVLATITSLRMLSRTWSST